MDTRNKREKILTERGAEGIIRYLASRGYSAFFEYNKVWVRGYLGELLTMAGAISFMMREVDRLD